jgi:hypothetical protein
MTDDPSHVIQVSPWALGLFGVKTVTHARTTIDERRIRASDEPSRVSTNIPYVLTAPVQEAGLLAQQLPTMRLYHARAANWALQETPLASRAIFPAIHGRIKHTRLLARAETIVVAASLYPGTNRGGVPAGGLIGGLPANFVLEPRARCCVRPRRQAWSLCAMWGPRMYTDSLCE